MINENLRTTPQKKGCQNELLLLTYTHCVLHNEVRGWWFEFKVTNSQ